MALVRDEGICIRRWDWSETSQTAVVFSRQHGVLRVLAKGSKRERGAFSGGLELTHRAEFQAITKPSTELAQLTSWDLAEVFPGVTRSAGAFYGASFALGAVEQAVRDHDPHPRLYAALRSFLRAGASHVGAQESIRFLWVLLDEAGYRPRLEPDEPENESPSIDGARSGDRAAPGPGGASVRFSPRLGRVVGGEDHSLGPAWRVRRTTIELLRSLEAAELAGADGAALRGAAAGDVSVDVPEEVPWDDPGDGAVLTRGGRFLATYLREILGRDLPGWERFVGGSGGGR